MAWNVLLHQEAAHVGSECVDEGRTWITDPTVPERVGIGKVGGSSAKILWIVASRGLNLWCRSSQPWYGNEEDECKDLRGKCLSERLKRGIFQGCLAQAAVGVTRWGWDGDGWLWRQQCWLCEQRGCHCSLRAFCCPLAVLGHEDSLAKPFLCPQQPPGLSVGRKAKEKPKASRHSRPGD